MLLKLLSLFLAFVGAVLISFTIMPAIPMMVAEYLGNSYRTPPWAWAIGALVGVACIICGSLLVWFGFSLITPTS